MSFGPIDQQEAAVFALEGLRADFQYEVLRALKLAGITQAELARRMNVAPAWVSQILSDDANVTLESIAKVFAALQTECRIETTAIADVNSKVPNKSSSAWQERGGQGEGGRAESRPVADTASFMRIVVRSGGRQGYRMPSNRNGSVRNARTVAA